MRFQADGSFKNFGSDVGLFTVFKENELVLVSNFKVLSDLNSRKMKVPHVKFVSISGVG